MAVFFTSDTRFGDARVIGLAKRPFATIAEHDAALIARWRAVIGPNDEVWHLGDVAPGWSHERIGALVDAPPAASIS